MDEEALLTEYPSDQEEHIDKKRRVEQEPSERSTNINEKVKRELSESQKESLAIGRAINKQKQLEKAQRTASVVSMSTRLRKLEEENEKLQHQILSERYERLEKQHNSLKQMTANKSSRSHPSDESEDPVPTSPVSALKPYEPAPIERRTQTKKPTTSSFVFA